ncbi:MAG: methylenetetrahydrofolate reductase, partial [Candidatus Omnitrophica bacterium]|nr:methylenetetrahydrofolate reductase [Candidatus Omnitrophota bacterium]
GIRNVLALTGDHPILGDHRDAKPVFDLDAVTLLQTVELLNKGKDLSGNELKGKPDLFCGAVCNPGADPIEPEVIKMEKKCEAGARFFQTQPVYDVRQFERFLSQTRHLKVPVLAGVLLLKSADMARFMNRNVAGINVTDELIMRMSESQDKKACSVEIAAQLIRELRPMTQGIHLMPMGWDKLVPVILDRVGLRG